MSGTGMTRNQDTVEKTAAYWVMRLSSSGCGPADRAAFEAWRSRHSSHAQAFERTERSLAFVGRHLEHPAIGNLIDKVMAETAPVKTPFWQSWAAASVAVVCVVVLIMSSSLQQRVVREDAVKIYDTAVGERSTITLADGSTVTLNTNSRIEVDFNPARRGINLVRGQALFEVAKNSSWPFVVEAGNQRITALGTAFDVRIETEKIKVSLIEGRVAVDKFVTGRTGPEQPVIPENRIELVEGEQLVTSATLATIVEKINLEELMGWREGRIVFRDTRLGAAIAEVNRYNKDQLRLSEDPRLQAIRISGVFKTGQIAPFISAMQTMHSVEAHHTAKNEITLRWR